MFLRRTPNRSPIAHDDAVALVAAAFRAVLGREPDPDGLGSYVQALEEGRTAAWLLESLAGSDERRHRDDPVSARVDRSGLTASSESVLSRELQRCEALPRDRYDALWNGIFASGRPLIVGQAEYAATHRERFHELMNAVVVLTRGRATSRILEFGPSEFSAMYARVVPGLDLVIADRPVPPDYVGFTESYCRTALGCGGHASIDLARIGDMDANLGALGVFDLIVMTVVIEHLAIHPVDVLARVLRRLAPDGALYLTTPNFFAQAHLDRLAQGENPCAVYPEGSGNWDAHHHFREYEAVELAEFIRVAGGRVDAFYFSSCWDAPDTELPAHRRGNMVYVVRRATA